MPNPADKLKLARRHLERVLAAWDTPTDWDDLSIYGLYCLEAAVEAAATHIGLMTSKKHWEKVTPQTSCTKSTAFPTLDNCFVISTMPGRPPSLDAEGVASEIELYVDAVAQLLEGKH